jgi:DNA-binding transcriptional ArsR family regulator
MTYYDVFHALQDDTRRKILTLLRREPKSVAEITARVAKERASEESGLALSRPAISQHLQVLLTAGMVSCTAEGSRNFYRLRRTGMELVRGYVEQLLKSPGLE